MSLTKSSEKPSRCAEFVTALALALVVALNGSCSVSGPRGEMIDGALKAYRSMKKGDWVIYYLNDINGAMLRVKHVDRKGVVIVRQSYFFGSPAMSNYALEYRFDDIKKYMEAGLDMTGKIHISEPEISRQTVVAARHTFDCTVYTVKIPDGTLSTYVSDKVPVGGVVMMKRNGAVIRRLIAFGSEEDPIIIPPVD